MPQNDEASLGSNPIASEVLEDVSMRSHTTTEPGSEIDTPPGMERQNTREVSVEPKPLGHDETEVSYPNPDSLSYMHSEDSIDEFTTDDGPATHSTQHSTLWSEMVAYSTWLLPRHGNNP